MQRLLIPGIYLNIKVPNSLNLTFKCFRSMKYTSAQCYHFSLTQMISISSVYSNKTIKFSLKSHSLQFVYSDPFLHRKMSIVSNLYFTYVPFMR